MSQRPFSGEPENENEFASSSAARQRASTFAFVLFGGSILFAALGVADSVTQPLSDLSKIVAVGLFVGAMVALAMGMIGDGYNLK